MNWSLTITDSKRKQLHFQDQTIGSKGYQNSRRLVEEITGSMIENQLILSECQRMREGFRDTMVQE